MCRFLRNLTATGRQKAVVIAEDVAVNADRDLRSTTVHRQIELLTSLVAHFLSPGRKPL